jgi:hypothetical protein
MKGMQRREAEKKLWKNSKERNPRGNLGRDGRKRRRKKKPKPELNL